MHKLNADFTTISMSVGLDQLPEHPLLLSLDNSASKGHLDGKLSIHVSLGESIARWIKQREELFVRETELFREARTVSVNLFELQRINIRNQVPMSHESSQQHLKSGQIVRVTRLIDAASRSSLILECSKYA